MSNDLFNNALERDLNAAIDNAKAVVGPYTGNVGPAHTSWGLYTIASAVLIAGRLIADAIRESGEKTVKSLDEIESAVSTTV